MNLILKNVFICKTILVKKDMSIAKINKNFLTEAKFVARKSGSTSF
jgi:hypothetical protein